MQGSPDVTLYILGILGMVDGVGARLDTSMNDTIPFDALKRALVGQSIVSCSVVDMIPYSIFHIPYSISPWNVSTYIHTPSLR